MARKKSLRRPEEETFRENKLAREEKINHQLWFMPGHITPAPVLILYFNTTTPCVLFSVLKLGTSPISLHSQSCWFPFAALQGSYSSMMCKSSLFDPNQRCFISCGLIVPMINFTFYWVSIPQEKPSAPLMWVKVDCRSLLFSLALKLMMVMMVKLVLHFHHTGLKDGGSRQPPAH